MMKNPITLREFAEGEEAEYAQSLIDSWAHVQKEKYQTGEDEKLLLASLDLLAGEPEVKKGTLKIFGETHIAKITRKINANYPRERGAEHPLRKLLGTFEKLANMISVEYKEKGSQIQALMDRLATGDLKLDDDAEIAEALATVRTEKAGKPSVAIQERIDTPA
jgi:hypothetical protein